MKIKVIVRHWRDPKNLPEGWGNNQELELDSDTIVSLTLKYDVMLHKNWLFLDDKNGKFALKEKEN